MFKKGFTLAEILITITVLGVIAALTLPALRADTEKQAFAQGFKRNYFMVNEGLSRMLADQDVSDLRDTKLWSEYVTEEITGGADSTTVNNIKKELSKYFGIDKVLNGNNNVDVYYLKAGESAGGSSEEPWLATKFIKFYLSNNTILYVQMKPGTGCVSSTEKPYSCNLGIWFLDLNADKKPNTIGKDIYRFMLGEDGKIHAYGDDVGKYLGRSDSEIDSEIKTSCNKESDGNWCSGQMIRNNYKIDWY